MYTLSSPYVEQPVMPSCTTQQDYLGAYLSYHGLITAGADLGTLATGDNVT